MKKTLQAIAILLLLSTQMIFANDAQNAFDKANAFANQGNYTKALEYFKISYEYEPADGTAFDLGFVYEELKEYDNAIKWYEKSYKMGKVDGGVNLGILYENQYNDYDNAIKWYKKAFNKGKSAGAYNLAMLYQTILKDYDKAIRWYKKAIEKGHVSAIKNLGYLYRTEKHDNLLSSAYMIGLIDKKYTKKQVINYLQNKLNVDEKTIKEAYKLQLTLIPNPYRDSEFEEEPKKRKSGRR